MQTFRLIGLAVKLHWDAQKSNPLNLMAGTVGMLINNTIVLWGLWVMLFDGKPNAERLTVYFLSLNAIVALAWGSLTFLLGGFRHLARYVEEGSLDAMLSTPRNPLILVGISASETPALGDILQGICNLLLLVFLTSPETALNCIFFSIISAIAFLGLLIIAGSIPLYIRRGSALATFILELNLSLSFFPIEKIFADRSRLLLLLTPALFTAVLPITAVDTQSWSSALLSICGAIFFFAISVKVFFNGMKRYQSSNYISMRN